jgi:hypothetical protein
MSDVTHLLDIAAAGDRLAAAVFPRAMLYFLILFKTNRAYTFSLLALKADGRAATLHALDPDTIQILN